MGIFDFFKKKQKEVIKKETTDENNINKFIEELTQKLEVEKDLAEAEMPGLMSLNRRGWSK